MRKTWSSKPPSGVRVLEDLGRSNEATSLRFLHKFRPGEWVWSASPHSWTEREVRLISFREALTSAKGALTEMPWQKPY